MKTFRTMLFMPGNNPGMLASAGNLGADSVILDLEDAVAPGEKDAARILVRRTLTDLRPENVTCVVRINGLDTPYWRDDLAAAVTGGTDVILLPKCEHPDMLREIADFIGTSSRNGGAIKIMALVESALGIENASAIASFGGPLIGMLLGAEDLTAGMGAKRTPEGDEIAYARGRMLMACKAAGIAAVDTPFPFVTDMEGLAKDAAYAAQLGFSGKALISPHHVHAVKTAFMPTAEQIAWASRVIETAEAAERDGKGAVSLDGMMIDLPIIKRAKSVLQMAE
ncbi:HpcH/HpaI aldolase/citrate lyase family protein [Pseudodesulfovibrio methanolicus]|uniref:CoA ester lyase n=1 Tax=Pseudodesulfovibrio methanolicus TaxID=3126690 RepID=A0ABZ2IRX9_9BACT